MSNSTLVKFSDDMTVTGLIINDDDDNVIELLVEQKS